MFVKNKYYFFSLDIRKLICHSKFRPLVSYISFMVFIPSGACLTLKPPIVANSAT